MHKHDTHWHIYGFGYGGWKTKTIHFARAELCVACMVFDATVAKRVL